MIMDSQSIRDKVNEARGLHPDANRFTGGGNPAREHSMSIKP